MQDKKIDNLRKFLVLFLVVFLFLFVISFSSGDDEVDEGDLEKTETESVFSGIDIGGSISGALEVISRVISGTKEDPKPIDSPKDDSTIEGVSDEEKEKPKDTLENGEKSGIGYKIGEKNGEGIGEGIGRVFSLFGGGGDAPTTPTQETPPETPSETPTKPGSQLCKDIDVSDVTFNATNLDSAIESITEEPESANSFLKQWCKFLDDKEVWNDLTPKQRNSLLEQAGKQYGANINIGAGTLEGATWENDNLVIGRTKINLDLEKYYSEENEKRDFGFRGDDWEYSRRDIREIKVSNGDVEISFGKSAEQGGRGVSSIKLSEGSEFDPNTMKIKSGEKEYSWNGRGEVDFNAKERKLNLNFAKGGSDADIRNFPIMKIMPGGEEVSPFQEVVDKEISGLEKPSSGFRVSEDGRYTKDSNGVVREIKNSEIKIDANGEIDSVKDSFLNKKEFEGELFAVGEFGIGKKEQGSYFDLTEEVLTIVNEGNNRLYYQQGLNLKELDVKGSGTTYIRNGDYVLKFKGDEFIYKKVPAGDFKEGGKMKYTIDKIVNQRDKDNPLKIAEKDGKLTLMDSSGKELPVGRDVTVPRPEETEEPGEPGDVASILRKYHIHQTGDTYSISSDGYDATVAVIPNEDGKVTSDKISIDGLGSLPEGLSYEDFVKKLGNELGITFTLTIESSWVGSGMHERTGGVKGALTKLGMGDELADLIVTEFREDFQPGFRGRGNKGNSLLININSGRITQANWAGRSLLNKVSENHHSEGLSFLQNTMQKIPEGDVRYANTNTRVNTPLASSFYELYQAQKK